MISLHHIIRCLPTRWLLRFCDWGIDAITYGWPTSALRRSGKRKNGIGASVKPIGKWWTIVSTGSCTGETWKRQQVILEHIQITLLLASDVSCNPTTIFWNTTQLIIITKQPCFQSFPWIRTQLALIFRVIDLIRQGEIGLMWYLYVFVFFEHRVTFFSWFNLVAK